MWVSHTVAWHNVHKSCSGGLYECNGMYGVTARKRGEYNDGTYRCTCIVYMPRQRQGLWLCAHKHLCKASVMPSTSDKRCNN